jgi:hypothetical protein
MNQASVFLCAALLVGACGGAAAPAATPSSPSPSPSAPAAGAPSAAVSADAPLTPRFGWKAGTRMTVAERMVNDTDDAVLTSTYDLDAQDGRDGLRIALSNVQADARGGHDDGTDMAREIVKLMQVLRPDYVVTPAGALARVELNEERMAKGIASLHAPPEMKEMLTGLLTAGAKASVKEDWDDLVETWTNRTLAPGAAFEVTQTHEVGILGPATFDAKASFAGYVPCPATKQTCAKLVIQSALHPGAKGSPKPESVDVHRRFEVVTDPATLLPFSSLLEVDSSLSLVPGQKPVKVKVRIERTYTHH